MGENKRRSMQSNFKNSFGKDGNLRSAPIHPYKILFKRNSLKLKDVAYHTQINYPSLVAYLGGYGSLTIAQQNRLSQFAKVVKSRNRKRKS